MLRPLLPLATAAALATLAACAATPRPAPGAGSTATAAAADTAGLTARITAQFARAARDWNRGDLDAFMADYVHDSATTFVSRGHLRHGWDAIRAGYAPRFAPGAQRDSLHFEELAVRPVGPAAAVVFGRFVLARGDSTTASGPFTLVMEHRADGWKIVHDHSSSD